MIASSPSNYRIDVITNLEFDFWVGFNLNLAKFYQFFTWNGGFNWGSIKICGRWGSIWEWGSNNVNTVLRIDCVNCTQTKMILYKFLSHSWVFYNIKKTLLIIHSAFSDIETRRNLLVLHCHAIFLLSLKTITHFEDGHASV